MGQCKYIASYCYLLIFYVARFTEYSYVLRYASGVPKHTVFFYECCKYPGYYMHWYCDQSAVNCEVVVFNLHCHHGYICNFINHCILALQE